MPVRAIIMITYKSKTLFFPLLILLVIASSFFGINASGNNCTMSCCEKKSNERSLLNITRSQPIIIKVNCCIANKGPCFVNNPIATYIFNPLTVNYSIKRYNPQKSHSLISIRENVVVLTQEMYNDRFRRFFIIKLPIYLMNSILIC
jgi:hypothetical protein